MSSSRKIKFKVKEERYESIAKYNVVNNRSYYLFNPMNVTSFKCKIGKESDKEVYIYEHLECMWGNDEIDEYVFFDDFKLQEFEDFKLEPYINNINFEGIDVFYTFKTSILGKWIYNAIYEVDNVRYYVIIKTIDPKKFLKLMKEHFNAQLSFNN